MSGVTLLLLLGLLGFGLGATIFEANVVGVIALLAFGPGAAIFEVDGVMVLPLALLETGTGVIVFAGTEPGVMPLPFPLLWLAAG